LNKERGNFYELQSKIRNFISDINDTLNCPISQDLIKDPVCTPNGVCYEKMWIEKYLKKDKKDPMTKQRLRVKNLVPNRALKNILSILKQEKYAFLAKKED
jgi:hypothetical protein